MTKEEEMCDECWGETIRDMSAGVCLIFSAKLGKKSEIFIFFGHVRNDLRLVPSSHPWNKFSSL